MRYSTGLSLAQVTFLDVYIFDTCSPLLFYGWYFLKNFGKSKTSDKKNIECIEKSDKKNQKIQENQRILKSWILRILENHTGYRTRTTEMIVVLLALLSDTHGEIPKNGL